jgi:hypothetical protein
MQNVGSIHPVATQVRGKHARPSPVFLQSKPHRLYGNEMEQGSWKLARLASGSPKRNLIGFT